MNDATYESELLGRFVADLARDPLTPVPVGLDTQTARLARLVVAAERDRDSSTILVQVTQARIWARVLTEAQAKPQGQRWRHRLGIAVVRGTRCWPVLHLDHSRRWEPLAWPVLAATLVLVVILGAIWTSRPQPVSAQEILQKVQDVTTSLGTSYIHSFVLTEAVESPSGDGSPTALSANGGDEPSQRKIKQWFEAPALWRIENADPSHGTSIEISDGAVQWNYDPAGHTAILKALPTYPGDRGVILPVSPAASDLNSVLQRARNCYTPKLLDDSSIAGRAAYVIDLGQSKCQSAAPSETNGRRMLWVDKDTFFLLKAVQYSETNGKILSTFEITDIQYNVPIDPTLFTFTPPPSVTVHDVRPKPAPNADEYGQQLAQLAHQADFSIFVPRDVPSRLVPRAPELDPQEGLKLAYVVPSEAGSDSDPAQHGVLLMEHKVTPTDAVQPPQTEPVQIGGVTGWFRASEHANTNLDRPSFLSLERDGTAIGVLSTKLSKEEMLQLVVSLQPMASR